eukprot:TRINITY_DN4562_c0_g1_i1.p1 TRINITY_DN4562_c0_g1~~TRINITY_DN4562_c0_g1_i1.p1  ORF type:complete len:278 (-),score=19.20 TRINITY_DN4562_c0_g1_i1:211-996(-)
MAKIVTAPFTQSAPQSKYLHPSIQDMWNKMAKIVTAPFTQSAPQSKYLHQTLEDRRFSLAHMRSCIVNYTVSSGGSINEKIIDETANEVYRAFANTKLTKKRSTPLLITGNNKTNLNEFWNCLSRMENYGRQLRISSSVPRTEFTDEIFKEISNSQEDKKLPRTIIVVDIDETLPTYNNTGEAAAYRGHLEGAIDDTMPIFSDMKLRQTRSDNVFIVMLLKTKLDLNGNLMENMLCLREYFLEQWTFRFWTRIVHQVFLPH